MVKQILEKIEKDKLLHFVAGSFVYASSSWFLGYYALALVVAVAVGKEVYDHYYNGTVDVWDAVATIVGGLVCMLPNLYV